MFGAFRAPGWPETDSPRKVITKSGVEVRIRALGTRFVAFFLFSENLRRRLQLELENYWVNLSGDGVSGDGGFSQHFPFSENLRRRLQLELDNY